METKRTTRRGKRPKISSAAVGDESGSDAELETACFPQTLHRASSAVPVQWCSLGTLARRRPPESSSLPPCLMKTRPALWRAFQHGFSTPSLNTFSMVHCSSMDTSQGPEVSVGPFLPVSRQEWLDWMDENQDLFRQRLQQAREGARMPH